MVRGRTLEVGEGWRWAKGGKWDNCNSINKKIEKETINIIKKRQKVVQCGSVCSINMVAGTRVFIFILLLPKIISSKQSKK